MIKPLAIILSLSLSFTTATMAADTTCNASVTEKKLAGATKTSCEKKCVKDTVGEAPAEWAMPGFCH